MDGTREDLTRLADEIDRNALALAHERDHAREVLDDRGYPDADAAEFAERKAEAYAGATQYAARLRSMAASMGEHERARDIEVQAEKVAHAAAMGGWLSDSSQTEAAIAEASGAFRHQPAGGGYVKSFHLTPGTDPH